MKKQTHTAHIPVLVEEVSALLAIAPEDVVLDGTAGGGGHMRALLTQLGEHGRYIACDADETAIARLRVAYSDSRITYCIGNFRHMDALVRDISVAHVDAILLDLGLSSDQLTGAGDNGSGRGFSFQHDEPLTMTLAPHTEAHTLTAATVVNEWSEESIADIIYGFGEERRARAIARAIVRARGQAPITTTQQLADIVLRAVPRTGRTHPATKTFQAIRMAVNDELGALEDALAAAQRILAPGGRIAIITFHSLEDRIVKRTFRAWEHDGFGVVLTKKPLQPTEREVAANPRARSAKVRGFVGR